MDMSWIQPGKAASVSAELSTAAVTAAINRAIDFAAESGLEYVMIGEGWAFTANGGTDLTRARDGIDLPGILARARDKGVGVWLTANWEAIDGQMEQAFVLFERWGVRGVKIDSMNRDDQWMVNFYRRVAKSAAEHHLMIDFHGAFKPDGLRRTFPNVLTREAVLGQEYARWGARANPDHNVTLALTRLLGGPLDYAPGSFENATREEFEARQDRPMALGTRAHQLALYVVFESPLQMVPGDPDSYRGEPAFEFIRRVPASWNETRALGGRMGEYAAVARRSGQEWYLGAIAAWNRWSLDVPLSFLDEGEYVAEIYGDGDAGTADARDVRIETKRVRSTDSLTLRMSPGGGAAVRFAPAIEARKVQ
jgi:alpha-glucosidase